jgi:hypothetical protein
MSLEQAIYDRWAAYQPLCQQIPAERVYLGTAAGCVTFPYATLARVRTVSTQRTSRRTFETVEFRLAIYDDDLARGQAAAAAMHERFAGSEFSNSGSTVHSVRRVNYVETEQASGAWLLAGDYHFHLSH